MEWDIVTGEYPPQHGGVSDYTYLLARALAEAGEQVHIWTPAFFFDVPELPGVEVHLLPRNFGLAWLCALDRGLGKSSTQRTLLVQYVPHMYGWKSMNIAFCCWLALRRTHEFRVMFHEVAFPFEPGQPWKHRLLAIVHRFMAWIILQSAQKSFTSTDAYKELLTRLAPKVPISLLRLFSNVPFTRERDLPHRRKVKVISTRPLVGVFSSFGNETCKLLEENLPDLLAGSTFNVFLIGPADGFIQRFTGKFPMYKQRLKTSGRVHALEAGPYLQACDVLLQLYPDGACPARGTLMAALASGVPVVTTGGPLTGTLLKTSGALAFTGADPSALRQVIESLLADKTAARNLGAAGRRLYETHFDLAVTLAVLSEGRLEVPAVEDTVRFA